MTMTPDRDDLAPTTRLRQASIGAGVTEHIREMIFTGQLEGDQRIPQDDIAADLGVSRLPVREALASLELDGLVRIEKHRGAYVLPVLRDDLIDHYEIFGDVHGIAAARAARTATPEQVAQLREIQAQLKAAESETEQHRLNWELHRVINVIGGTRRLQSIVRGLTRQIPRSFRFRIPPATAEALAEHDAILDAIEAGDDVAAAEACVVHLRREALYIVDYLDEQGFFAQADPTPGGEK